MINRRLVQTVSAVLTNSYFKGFAELSIYQGQLKKVCVPVFNCYSCPGALGSCPVGSMQFMLASYKHESSLYIAGLLTVVGASTGRLVCGWLCPFGFIQELLGKLSSVKFAIPDMLKPLKYVVLVLTLLLPVVLLDQNGLGTAYFCKYVCPAGTLEAGIPLGLGRPELRSLLGVLFTWKIGLLIIFIAASIFTFRPFCLTVCPLGAFYALFNPISLWRLERDSESCTLCGACSRACPVDLDVTKDPNHPECIRCLKCTGSCSNGCLSFNSGIATRVDVVAKTK